MIYDKLKKYNIILASQSPRRIMLLKELGIDFSTSLNHEVEEVYPSGLDKFGIPVYLSELKSNAYGDLKEGDLLITADTIVWFRDQVINKPTDLKDAVRILKLLAGEMHEVITGVCLRTGSHSHTFFSHTEVYFGKLSEEEIEYYVNTCKPMDKAGAYGIQEWIGYIGIEKIVGSWYNVMGLPVQKLYHEFERFLNNELINP